MTDQQRRELLEYRDYYLSHLDKFVEEYLGIKLTPIQKLTIRLIKIAKHPIFVSYPKSFNRQFLQIAWLFSACSLNDGFHIVVAEDENGNQVKRIFDFIRCMSEEAKEEITVASSTPTLYIKFKNGSTIIGLKTKIVSTKLLGKR